MILATEEAWWKADRLIEGMNHHDPVTDMLDRGATRKDFARVAANIAKDAYLGDSITARCTIVIMLRHGVQAAIDFAEDLAHHEA